MSLRRRLPGTDKSVSENIKDEIKPLIKKAKIVSWQELPAWQQDNHFILSGYRVASGSFRKSFASLGYIHNESVNIYSHLIGAIFFTLMASILYAIVKSSNVSNAKPADMIVFACFFLGCGLCLGMSATYHTISNHSPSIARFGNKLDYVGIVSLIVGSFIPSIYYAFFCHPVLQKLYWSMISFLGMVCATVSIYDRFRTPSWRPFRASMFIAMGLSAVFPVIHGLKIYGFYVMRYRIGLIWLVLQGFLYILGAIIYAVRWPECIRPGQFDIWGSSHQIFHVLVVMAALCHFYGLSIAFNYNHQSLLTICK